MLFKKLEETEWDLKFLNINPSKVSKSAQLKIHQARIVKRGIFRVVHMISELNSKGNVFELYSVYVFSCASSAKLH